MTAAEELLSCPAETVEEYAAYVNDRAMIILEACGFHDLTGQRVTKITDVLRIIEERTQRFASQLGVSDTQESETESEKRNRERMLSGPAIVNQEIDQAAIDDLFS